MSSEDSESPYFNGHQINSFQFLLPVRDLNTILKSFQMLGVFLNDSQKIFPFLSFFIFFYFKKGIDCESDAFWRKRKCYKDIKRKFILNVQSVAATILLPGKRRRVDRESQIDLNWTENC